MLEVKDLSVGYNAPLLTDIRFTVNDGEILGILGRNGSGKTTLLRGLSGSIRRFSGEIAIDGKNCTALKPKQQAAYLSVLPQRTDIMDGILARDVLEMGRYPYEPLLQPFRRDNGEGILEAARKLGIERLLDADCGKLSQGQRQMILLARLLVQDTRVLLLDEPNAALDYDNSHTLFSMLRSLVDRERKTAVLVLHDPELALKWCDRILVLNEGRICADLPAKAEETEITQALAQLYPKIRVRKDPFDGCFRCYSEQ